MSMKKVDFDTWYAKALEYGRERYCWDDMERNDLSPMYIYGITARAAVDTIAESCGLTTVHEFSGKAAWGQKDDFPFEKYEVSI
jgi:hypothetical protein